jgi:Nucleotidyl transferase
MTAHGKQIDLGDWPVAILVGGLSTRLRPMTDKTPKALLSVAGEPFLTHQLRSFILKGFAIRCYDKKMRTAEMRHIDYGIAVLSAEVFAPLPNDAAFDSGGLFSPSGIGGKDDSV